MARSEHRRRQVAEGADIELADANDLVFTWPDGRPLHPDLIADWFRRHAKWVVWDQRSHGKVGLPPIRLHDVRHSYATAALAGIPANIVQRTARPRQRPDHPRHLQPCHPGPRRAGGRDRGPAHPRGLRHRFHGRARQRCCQFCCQNGRRPPLSRGGEGRSPW